jgi:hypothetical protein
MEANNSESLKLWMVLIGCKPLGRHTEQHDVCFGIGPSIKSMVPQLKTFWPEAAASMHVDGYRVIENIGDYKVNVLPHSNKKTSAAQLFFINLGGYKQGDFEEYHYKMIVAATDTASAIQQAKQTAFYKHTGFKGAESHVDDKYGIDVDDVYKIEEVLPKSITDHYQIVLTPSNDKAIDELHLGYFILKKLEK